MHLIYEVHNLVQSLKKAHEIQPNNMDILKKIGQLYDSNGKLEEAVSFFKGVTTKFPENIQLLEMLGYLYGRQVLM